MDGNAMKPTVFNIAIGGKRHGLYTNVMNYVGETFRGTSLPSAMLGG